MTNLPISPEAQALINRTSATIDRNKVVEYANKIVECFEKRHAPARHPIYYPIPKYDVITEGLVWEAMYYIKNRKRPCIVESILSCSKNPICSLEYIDNLEIYDCVSPEYKKYAENCKKMWKTLLPETRTTIKRYLYAGHEDILNRFAEYSRLVRIGITSLRKIHNILETITSTRAANNKYYINESHPKLCKILARRIKNHKQRVQKAIEKIKNE